MRSDTPRSRRPETGTRKQRWRPHPPTLGAWKPRKLNPVCPQEQDPECWQVHRPGNAASGPQLHSSSQAQTCPDPRLTSSPGSPGSPARPASPCIERVVRGSSHLTWPPSTQCSGPWAGPSSPSHPEALAVLGHLWPPVEKGQETTWALGSLIEDTQGRRHEAQGQMQPLLRKPRVTWMGEQCCWRLNTHRFSYQVSREASRRSLIWDMGQADASASSTWPLPQASPTLTFSPFAPGSPTTAYGECPVSYLLPCLLPDPICHPGWEAGTRHGEAQRIGVRVRITCPGAPMGPGSPLGPTGPGRPGDPCDRAERRTQGLPPNPGPGALFFSPSPHRHPSQA